MRWCYSLKYSWDTDLAPLRTFLSNRKLFCCQWKDRGRRSSQIKSSSDVLLQKNPSKVVAVTCSTTGLDMAGKCFLGNTSILECEAVLAKARVLLYFHKWARALVCCTGKSTVMNAASLLPGELCKSFCILMDMIRLYCWGFQNRRNPDPSEAEADFSACFLNPVCQS